MIMNVVVDTHSFCFAVDVNESDAIDAIERKIKAEIAEQFAKAVASGKVPATISLQISRPWMGLEGLE